MRFDYVILCQVLVLKIWRLGSVLFVTQEKRKQENPQIQCW